jgi:hypothetical protein
LVFKPKKLNLDLKIFWDPQLQKICEMILTLFWFFTVQTTFQKLKVLEDSKKLKSELAKKTTKSLQYS